MALVLSFLCVVPLPGSAQAASASGTSAQPYTYTVTIPGDGLTQIVERLCGHVRYWRATAAANHLTEPYWVDLKQTIVVPCARSKPAPISVPAVSQKQILTPVLKPALQPTVAIKVPVVHQKPRAKQPSLRISLVLFRHFMPKAKTWIWIAFGIFVILVAISIYALLFGGSKSAKPAAVTPTPKINPTLTDLRDAVTAEIPGVTFVQDGILCVAKFDNSKPFDDQPPTVVVLGPDADFYVGYGWDQFREQVEKINSRIPQRKDTAEAHWYDLTSNPAA